MDLGIKSQIKEKQLKEQDNRKGKREGASQGLKGRKEQGGRKNIII